MKDNLLTRRFRWFDTILVVVCAVLTYACLSLKVPFSEIFNHTTELNFGYIARTSDDIQYVIDSGHARLIAFDRDEQELFEILDPSDNEESALYIDDVFVDEDALYLTASEWDGMYLSRELILAYDKSGNYQEKIRELTYDYEDNVTNKHRIYGLHREGGQLVWAELRDDAILVNYHRLGSTTSDTLWTFQYDNAFNAVSDLVFDSGDLIILNKNGRLERSNTRGEEPELLYSTEVSGEFDRIPFRLTSSAGSFYFTDIMNSTVQRVLPDSQSSETVYEGTDSETVTFSDDGKEMLLSEADGLLIVKDGGTWRYSTLHLAQNLSMRRIAYLVVLVLLAIAAVFAFIRFICILMGRSVEELTTGPLVAVTVAFIVCAIVSYILLGSFRELYLGKIHEQLQMTASQVSLRITEDDIAGVTKAQDFGQDSYNRLIAVMDESMPIDVDFFHTTYCNILRIDDEGEWGHAIAYRDQSIGTYFPLDEVESAEVVQIYETGEPVWNDESLDATGSYVSVKVPILGANDKVVGVVAVGADTYVVNELIDEMQKEVLLSIVLVLLLFWIIASEAIAIASQNAALTKEEAAEQPVPPYLIRLLVFAIFAAFNLVSSFLPVYVLRNSEAITGAWHELASTLPLTINIFAMGVMSLFCASAMRRFGAKKVFVGSMLCSLAGNLLLFLAAGYPFIVLGLLLDGIGVGMITNAIYVALTYLPDEASREGAFATYNGASLSGINFGMILGSILAVSIGQRIVFLVVVVSWAALALVSMYVAARLDKLMTRTDDEGETERKQISTGRFISSRPIWSFILLVQNPYIVFNSFAYYFVPLFCDSMGLRETIASVLLMLYSQTAVMLTDSLTDSMEKTFGGRSVYVALALNVVAVALYVTTNTLWGLVVALLLLGISASFAKPCQQSLYLRQDVSKQFGEDNAMGIYNFSENIGESLGPIVFGSLMAGPLAGVWTFLGSVCCAGAAHFALNKKEMTARGE